MFQTLNYAVTAMDEKDIPRMAEIYNSNREFLLNHVGTESVGNPWALREHRETREAGFSRGKIIDRQSGLTVGFIDFKISEEVYLSLLMVHGESKKSGIGKEITRHFEEYARAKGGKRIRIDVVTGYNEAVMRFWRNNGFVPEQEITLSWGGKEFRALEMIKALA